MYSELIVMVGAGREDADQAWRALERGQGGEFLTLLDMALIQRDEQGKSAFQMHWKEPDYSYEQHPRLAGAFAEAIFGLSRTEGQHHLAKAGLDPLFMEAVDQDLNPGGSAYLIYVPRESRVDTRHYLKILGRLPGVLYQTTFRSQVEEVLLKQKS